MSTGLKIGILLVYLIVGFAFVYLDKISWLDFIGSLAVFNSGILMFEEYIKNDKI